MRKVQLSSYPASTSSMKTSPAIYLLVPGGQPQANGGKGGLAEGNREIIEIKSWTASWTIIRTLAFTLKVKTVSKLVQDFE